MKKNQIVLLAIILLFIATAAIYTWTTTARPDPETGVKVWIAAVNDRDYARIYDLTPMEIRHQISRDDFIKEQEANPLLASGNSFDSYIIIQRTVSGDNSILTAQLVLATHDSGNSTSKKIPLYLKFIEHFENGEWKVWTTEP